MSAHGSLRPWSWKKRGSKASSRRRSVAPRLSRQEYLEDRLMMAADLRDLLVADHVTDSILRFDGETGAPLGAFVASGAGGLVNPHNPTFGPDGNLYVFSTQPGSQKILEYDGDTGAFVGTFVNTGSGGFAGGFGMAFGPNGDLYVATGGANVLRYDGDTGAFVGIAATGNGIIRASGVEFGPDGNLYVLDSDLFIDTAYDRILRFNAETAALIDVFVQPGSLEDSVSFAFGPDGHIYVPDLTLEQTRVFNGTTGALQQVFTGDDAPIDSFNFDLVWGPDGNVYAPTTERILRFDGETSVFLNTFVEGEGGSIVFFPPAGPAADLEVTIDSFPPNAFIGENLSITYTVDNISANAVPADEWVDVLYWSADDIFDPFDAEIGRIVHTGGLGGNTSYTETLNVAAPDILPGDYHVIVVTDRRSQAADTLRANNFAGTVGTTEVLPEAENIDPAHTLAVGRTLSSWTTAGLVGNELTITYTVYNLTDDYVSDVSMTTTLGAGVVFSSATAPTTQSGQQLTWDAGRLGPLGFFTVDVTVTFPGAIPLQLDGGASADGVVNFTTAIGDGANPATLRTDAIDPALLASTLDANSDDIYIRAKAAELNQDVNEIFSFLKQEIGYESYYGSLRGARGTLWSNAGNALDEASLMVALLRASGIEAGYVQGTLGDALAQDLILSIFPNYTRVFGIVNPGVPLADPLNDPQLLAETKAHTWVGFDAGAGFLEADPTFASAALGQTFAAAEAQFSEVPDALRHKVNVRLNREITSPGASLLTGGLSQDTATVIDEDFAAAELVGTPISLGHFVTTSVLSTVFSAVTHKYTPVIFVNQRDGNLADDPFSTGTEYQEFLTSFPLGTQILTGVFAEFEITTPEPDGTPTSAIVQKTLLDRIGFTARENGTAINLNVTAGDQPAFSEQDVATFEFAGWRLIESQLTVGLETADSIGARLNELLPRAQGLPDNAPEVSEARRLLQSLAVGSTAALSGAQLEGAGPVAELLGSTALARLYPDSPEVVAVLQRLDVNPATQVATSEISVDILRSHVRTLAAPIQAASQVGTARALKGLTDKAVEQSLGSPSATGTFSQIVAALAQPNVDLVAIGNDNLAQLASYDFPVEAVTRITSATERGKVVLVPEKVVEIDGVDRLAWIELDPITGEMLAVSDDGTHSLTERTESTVWLQLRAAFGKLPNSRDVQTALNALRDATTREAKQRAIEALLAICAEATPVVATINIFVEPKLFYEVVKPFHAAENATQAAASHLQSIRNSRLFNLKTDPPIGTALYSSVSPSPEFAALGDGMTSGVAVAAFQDPDFSVPLGGAELPLVFRVGFKNLESSAHTFDLTPDNIPSGFIARQSVSSMTLQPGETGEFSLALIPVGGVPAQGTPLSLNVHATSQTNPLVTGTALAALTVPAIAAAEFSFDPPAASTTPGVPLNYTLTINSVGNSAAAISFDVELPADLSLSGLSPVTLAPGQTVTQTLTLTPSAAVPLNSFRSILITPQYGQPVPEPIAIALQIAAPGADAIHETAVSARELGNAELAERLTFLGVALTELVQSPDNGVFKSQALANLDGVIQLLSIDPLLPTFHPPFGEIQQDLIDDRDQFAAASTQAECLAAIDALAETLEELAALMDAVRNSQFELTLSPNVQVAQPLAPKEFVVSLHNVGTETSTYNLAVSGLPPEVTSLFSETQVTLVRDEFRDVTLTLTQTTTDELLAFDFSVDVSIHGVTPAITKSATGSLRTRNEVVSVTSVVVEPAFVDPDGAANVTARILNAVNRQRDVVASFVVKNSLGDTVFTSGETNVSLGVVQSLVDVDLGEIDTTGLPEGEYTVTVSLFEAGQPIPGATRDGRLLIGSPVNAELSVTPESLPPGDSVVTNTLEISLGTSTGGGSLELVGQLAIIDTGLRFGIAKRDDLLYISGLDGVHIVDVTPQTAPTKVGFESGRADSLTVIGDVLYVMDEGPSTNSPAFARGSLKTYTLTTGAIFPPTTPTDPFFRASHIFGYQFVGGPHVIGDKLYATQLQFRFSGTNIVDTTGDMLSFDVSNVSSPQLLDVLIDSYGTGQDAEGIRSGSPFSFFGLAQAGANTVYVASTNYSIVSDATTAGTGLVRIVDISNPASLTQTGTLAIPGTTFVTAITVVGNRAYVVGTQGGWKDPFVTLDDPGPTGNIVLTTLDITNPLSPSIVGQITLDRAARGVGGLASVGDDRFIFTSLGELTDTPKLYMADFSDPDDVQLVQAVDLTDIPRTYTTDGQFVYIADTAGLKVFSLNGTANVPVHAEVQIPNGTGVEVVDGSFNIAPTEIIPGVDFDTLVWDLNLTGATPTQTITWQSNVTALQPGETRPVTLDSTVDFTFNTTPGDITLPPETVFSEQVLGLSPASQSKRPGEAAVYTVTIENPSAVEVAYDLAVVGVPQDWVDMESFVVVPAGDSVDIQLTLTSGPFTVLGDFAFVVQATTGDVTGSVEGLLTLVGDPLLAADFGVAKGVFVELIPTSNTAGQGTSASYKVRVTNTGSATDQFVLFATGLPVGFTILFDSGTFDVPPGATNFREFNCIITPPVGATAADYPFEVFAASITDAVITGFADGSLTVLDLGVDVDIVETSGSPGSVFQMLVTNTGDAAETFDLAIAAPAALAATLEVSEVTLGPGDSQVVEITVGEIDFAFPGALLLVGVARSRTNNAVLDGDSADVTIDGVLDMTAAFEQNTIQLPAPGPGSFLLLVENIGNLEDNYTVEIIDTTGPVTASLRGLTGQPTASIPLFILPGLSTGAVSLESILTGFGTGTVTLQVRSLIDDSIVAEATANISAQGVLVETTTTVITTAGTTYGDLFTFEATVSAESGTPDGFVQFQIDGSDVGSPVALVGGVAMFTTSTTLAADQYTITAIYADTAEFAGSQGNTILDVDPAALEITADDKLKVYGADLPTLTVSYDGFVNGDDPDDLDTLPTISTTATESSDVDEYPITASGAVAANYIITYVPGTLEITQAELTITAENKIKKQNDPLPLLTARYDGLVNGDTPADLDTPPVLSTAATDISPPGDYVITVSNAADRNYDIRFVNGNLHVDPPAPTVGVDVRLTSTGLPGSIVAGKGTVTYTFTVKNIGTLDATNLKVQLASILPPGVTVRSVTPPKGTSFSGTAINGTWTITSLKKNASVTLCVTLQVGSSVTPGVNAIRLTATAISAKQALINTSNDSTTQTTSITTVADLAITKHSAPSSIKAGDTITYQVTVRNNGSGVAQNVSLVDTLPSGVTFVSQSQTSGPAFTLSNTTGKVTNTIATLASGQSASFTIVAKVATSVSNKQKLVNKVSVSSDSTDPKSSNNSWEETTTVSSGGHRPRCQNPGDYDHANMDVDDDGDVSLRDIVLLLDRINRGVGELLEEVFSAPYFDVNGDDYCSIEDLLPVIDHVNRKGSSQGSGLLASFDSSGSTPAVVEANSTAANVTASSEKPSGLSIAIGLSSGASAATDTRTRPTTRGEVAPLSNSLGASLPGRAHSSVSDLANSIVTARAVSAISTSAGKVSTTLEAVFAVLEEEESFSLWQ